MGENKTGKYLKYAIGEIVLVVIGILIALSINNWNENRKSDEIRKNYYHQLVIDLENELNNLEKRIDGLNKSIESHNSYNDYAKTSNLELKEIVKTLLKVDYTIGYVYFNTNTIETLESTGDIKLMPSDIKNRLIEIKRLQDRMIKIATGTMPEIVNVEYDGFKLGALRLFLEYGNQQTLNKKINDNVPEMILTLESAINLMNYTKKERLEGFKKMRNDVEELKELINLELEK